MEIATGKYNQTVDGYNICGFDRKRWLREAAMNLTYHTNTGAKGVWWNVAPEFSFHDTRISMRASNRTSSRLFVMGCKVQGETRTPR